ncbi:MULTISPECIES: L,D-transpeptidase family protein [Mycolicibacterium]|nr:MULTISPECIES: L,D-transpeptidase family protein [Mycolicibacterium]MCV7126214.1 L,D-transpeptidase family protein [Mycolicibacterium vanbaalenii PYR-1]QZT57394.1 L,D-transpeptidase family protein [Mycolicibacterium austroafricanum]
MFRLPMLLCAALLAALLTPAQAVADFSPWFANSVGPATQVLAVTGTGGSDAKLDVWERTAAGWQPVAGGVGIPAKIGEKGMSPNHFDGSMMTPKGIYTLDFAFGTQPNPGGGLKYVQVGPNHWWDGDMKSPTYNTMQVCDKENCPFNTSLSAGTENLDIPQYAHAVVMGVNKERIPGKGGAFFVHSTDGGATAGCVAIDDATLVTIMRWLRPGAMIAITE